jgi:hypothetical protein
MTKIQAVGKNVGFALCLLLFTNCSLFAQKAVPAGTVEWNGYGGGTFDLPGAASFAGLFETTNPQNTNQQFKNGRKIQPFLGSGITVSLGKFFALYGDYSYIFTDRSVASAALLNSTATTDVRRHYWLATGGVQLTFPTVQRASPYVEFGGGVLHQSFVRTSQFTNVIGPTFSQQRLSNDIAAPHIGGGVRIFLTERQGLRFAVDGYYLGRGLEQEVPGAVQGTFPTITRRGWGRITGGYFIRFGRH